MHFHAFLKPWGHRGQDATDRANPWPRSFLGAFSIFSSDSFCRFFFPKSYLTNSSTSLTLFPMFVIVVSHHVPSLACWNKNRIFRSLSTRLTILIWAGNSQGEVHLTPQPSKKQQLESWNKAFGILKQFSEARMQMMQGGEKAGFPALHSLWKTARKLFTDYRAIMALQKKPRRKHNWHIQFSVFTDVFVHFCQQHQ